MKTKPKLPQKPEVKDQPLGTKVPLSEADQALLERLEQNLQQALTELALQLSDLEDRKQQIQAAKNQARQQFINAVRGTAQKSGVDLSVNDSVWDWDKKERCFIRTK